LLKITFLNFFPISIYLYFTYNGTYHITSIGKNISTPDTLLRSGNWLMETLEAFKTFNRLIRTIVVWRTSSAKHLSNTETWWTGNEIFDVQSAVVRFEMSVDQRQLGHN